ncbi:hypothetical protein CBR_g12367 [Chara braunii]|uniref:Uncharacterized protein n=1 Tax=Chara braunii TaxID=69332 RepID=A0A388KRY8_CHABU|nr:hypothetical protein CBR_g12367 [Chara braunii]|eukprot:GBG72799.1 hypothetical protein CBR_g12367 [Chara braunii]
MFNSTVVSDSTIVQDTMIVFDSTIVLDSTTVFKSTIVFDTTIMCDSAIDSIVLWTTVMPNTFVVSNMIVESDTMVSVRLDDHVRLDDRVRHDEAVRLGDTALRPVFGTTIRSVVEFNSTTGPIAVFETTPAPVRCRVRLDSAPPVVVFGTTTDNRKCHVALCGCILACWLCPHRLILRTRGAPMWLRVTSWGHLIASVVVTCDRRHLLCGPSSRRAVGLLCTNLRSVNESSLRSVATSCT